MVVIWIDELYIWRAMCTFCVWFLLYFIYFIQMELHYVFFINLMINVNFIVFVNFILAYVQVITPSLRSVSVSPETSLHLGSRVAPEGIFDFHFEKFPVFLLLRACLLLLIMLWEIWICRLVSMLILTTTSWRIRWLVGVRNNADALFDYFNYHLCFLH